MIIGARPGLVNTELRPIFKGVLALVTTLNDGRVM